MTIVKHRLHICSKDLSKDEEDAYGELDASRSLLLHGLESDFIEDEMAEDKEFRLDLLNVNYLKSRGDKCIIMELFQERGSGTKAQHYFIFA